MTEYWHGDPADVSLNAICLRAGVSKPSLYREFGSEDGLARAALDRYAAQVLVDVLAILQAGNGFRATLDALISFACDDPRMETGCLFYKMRNGRHRLGPLTRARMVELDTEARRAYEDFLSRCRTAGEWPADSDVLPAARYLLEQMGLAITQRASGEAASDVRETLTLAFSVFGSPSKKRGRRDHSA
ncbi:TetR/AcrR family transcriptional regulator [Gemmatimonas phototrophica]|uniref:TetR/AcrR family transcriptional regulator n=1 Tax=Gemmatimonas phototrophica TaxID=1379270 RepID=UPI0006A6F82E|nr:TetR/AcrR family transcriptional regulator [Gemmatimonas phototrophica]